MNSKSTVNPNQCKIINDILSPTAKHAYETAEIVKVLKRAKEKGEGQTNLKGTCLKVPNFLNTR